MNDLHSLMERGESTYIVSADAPPASALACSGLVGVLQFEWPEGLALAEIPATAPTIEPLDCAHADEMVALTDVAFPGFFRPRTCELGPYRGIRTVGGDLIAMCGERMGINDFGEISGLCTHPDHRGHGYAKLLMAHQMHAHRQAGLRSYLHVASSNSNAIALYQRMGFLLRGEFHLYLLTRNGD